MIKYALRCTNAHGFESWFQSAETFDKVKAAGMVACPVCGTQEVEKAIMAPRVTTLRSEPQTDAPTLREDRQLSKPSTREELAIAELKTKIQESSEYVGKKFAAEARAIHEGSAPERAIYGEANQNEAIKLIEEGVPVMALPFVINRKTN